jgi:hypothetical protein
MEIMKIKVKKEMKLVASVPHIPNPVALYMFQDLQLYQMSFSRLANLARKNT